MAISELDLLALNAIINESTEALEQRSISSLIVNKAYIIKKISVVNTRFGKSIAINLFEESTVTTFKSFLPKRVVEVINEDIINKINSSGGKYTLTYLGQRPPMYIGAKSSAIIQFGI